MVIVWIVHKVDCVLLNSGAKKRLYRGSKPESQHPRTQCSHASGVGSSGRIFLLLLFARVGIEAISKPRKELIVEVHAQGVVRLSKLPDHHDRIAEVTQYA